MDSVERARRGRLFSLALAAIALLAAIPRYLVDIGRRVEYDGYWHVWIAQQNLWKNFLWEYRDNAHPPLYYLLLRLSMCFGQTHLVYRSVSILAGVASVYVLGRTAEKAMLSRSMAVVTAVAYGLSVTTIEMSDEVRSYMLATFLIQISFYYFLDLTGEAQPATLRPRFLFGLAAGLACLTEYYAVFYIGAVFVAAFVLPLLRGGVARARSLLREIVTFALILTPGIIEYILHFGTRKMAYDHLPGFYYVPGGEELPGDYLFRTFKDELNLFLPWHVRYGASYYGWIAAFVAAACLIVFLTRPWRERQNIAARVSLAVTVLILGVLMWGGVIQAYPFGGFQRQQFILFPFAVIYVFLLADRLVSRLPAPAALAVAAALGAGVLTVGVRHFEAMPMDSRDLFSDQMDRFNREFPSPAAVYIDGYNLIAFFIHHHDWKWQYAGRSPDQNLVLYQISRDGKSSLVICDRNRWLLEPDDREIYRSLASVIQARNLPSAVLLRIAQNDDAPPKMPEDLLHAKIESASSEEMLCAQSVDIEGGDIFAELRRAGSCRN